MAPLVSVVITVHNRVQYLAQAIESVLAQTHRNREVLLIDDGSTEDIQSVVARYTPDVRYIWQANAERGAARNHGLRLAQGEFIAFLDSDDFWFPEKLERDLLIIGRRSEFGLVYSDAWLTDSDGRPQYRLRRRGYTGWVTEPLLLNNFINFSAHLVRAACLRQISGFREERQLLGCEDWEAWLRLSQVTQFGYVAEATAAYRIHDGNTTTHPEAMEHWMRYLYHLLESDSYLTVKQRRLLPRVRAAMQLRNAASYCAAGDRARTWALLGQALLNDPLIAVDWRFGYTLGHSALPMSASIRLRRALRHLRQSIRSLTQPSAPS
jgi:glycosyltransferase involved in cell wall biosynthesis